MKCINNKNTNVLHFNVWLAVLLFFKTTKFFLFSNLLSVSLPRFDVTPSHDSGTVGTRQSSSPWLHTPRTGRQQGCRKPWNTHNNIRSHPLKPKNILLVSDELRQQIESHFYCFNWVGALRSSESRHRIASTYRTVIWVILENRESHSLAKITRWRETA